MMIKYPFWVLKSDARRLLKGKWNAVVLALFIPFLLYTAFVVKLTQLLQETPSLAQQESFFWLQYGVTMGFTVVLELISVGIFRNLQPNREKASCLNIYAVGFQNFFKLLPTLLIKVGFPLAMSLLLSSEWTNLFYDYLMFSLMSMETYIVILQIVSMLLEILTLYFTLSLLMVPCILSHRPECGGIAAIKESFLLSKGNRIYLVGLSFSFFGWILLGSLAFTIGILWAMAYLETAYFAYYRRLVFHHENIVEIDV